MYLIAFLAGRDLKFRVGKVADESNWFNFSKLVPSYDTGNSFRFSMQV